MIAKIQVTLKKDVLDPQGKAVHHSLSTLGFNTIDDVRVGKYIEVKLKKSLSPEVARKQVDDMCKKLLANEVIENYQFSITG